MPSAMPPARLAPEPVWAARRPTPLDTLSPPGILAGGGEMGALMRAHDWSTSPLGPPGGWPQSLRSVVGLLLHSRFPMFLAWGPQLAFFYNDGYRPILGAKHPAALGVPFRRVWPEIWDDIQPFIARALAGEATWSENLHLVMHRNGNPEDTWYTFSYSTVHDEAGAVAGMFCVCACTETTAKVLADRTQAFLLALEERLRGLDDPRALMAAASEALGQHLGASRVGFAEIDPNGEFFTVQRDWTDDAMPSLAGRYRLDDFGPDLIREYRAGRVVGVDDVLTDPRVAGAAFAAFGIRAGIGVPLLRAGRFAAALNVHQTTPRRWREDEMALVRDVAERTWSALERAQAEAALRESEARWRSMFDRMQEGFLLGEIIRDDSGRAVDFRHLEVSKGWERQTGIPADGVVGRRITEVAPGIEDHWVEAFARVVETGEHEQFEQEAAPFGRWFEVSAYRTGPERFGLLFTDVTERRAAREKLQRNEERLRLALAAGALGDWELDVARNVSTRSVRHDAIFGHPEGVPDWSYEAFLSHILPEDRPAVDHAFQAAIAAGTTWHFAARIRRADDGAIRWIDGWGDPRGEGRMHGLVADITERKLAEETVRTAEERLRFALEAGRLGAWRLDLRTQVFEASAMCRTNFGQAADAPLGYDDLRAVIHADDRDRMERAVARSVATGEDYDIEYRVLPPQGEPRWVQIRGRPSYAPDGTPLRLAGVSLDITDRKAAEAALREGEARFRALVEVSAQVVWTTDAKGATFEASPTWHAYTGQTPAEWRGWGWLDAIHPEDRERTATAWRAALAATAPYEIEYRLRHHAGGHRWTLARGTPLLDPDGNLRMWVGMNTDIEERKRSEARTMLLTREVDHRAKNALAVVQAVLRLTRADDPKAFLRAVEGRVAALARAQTLLARDRWEGADLETLVRGELAPFADDLEGPRAALAGPSVTLPPGTAQPVSMAVHELATNALKYGALSVPDGRVTLSWSLERGAGCPDTLRLRWAEAGGPTVQGVPTRRGFGSRVLEETVRGQLGGVVELRWRPQGLDCHLSLPLREVPGEVLGEVLGDVLIGQP